MSAEEIALMNQFTELSKEVSAAIERTKQVLSRARDSLCLDSGKNGAELARFDMAEPMRWLAIAKTDFQTGFMALKRSVAQPDNF